MTDLDRIMLREARRDARSRPGPWPMSMRLLRNSLALAALLGSTCLAQAGPPVVTVAYSPREDLLCSLLPGSSIKDEWKTELLSRQPEFEALWAQQGPRLLGATQAITGQPFPSQAVAARLTLCNTPSESFAATGRVTINMRYALQSFTPTPVPLRYKVDTLFHELLHIFLASHPVTKSRLLEAHASEPERVRNHLHLLALEKAVLLKLGEADALKMVIDIDSQLPGGFYKRAWEIVDASEGDYLAYVAEVSR